jgi:hypothetical protein
MIESTNLFTQTSGRPSYDINDDLDDENLLNQDQDENLNQLAREFEEKQLTAPQEPEIQGIELQTENDLIADLRSLSRQLNLSTIVTYWGMGRKINAFYKGKYGANELQRIADGTDVRRDTLGKACKFAKNYSEDHLKILIKGNFHLSWSQISQNLTVEPGKLIGVYQQVHNPSEFHNDIMKLKDPGETRGKAVKKVKTGENVRVADVLGAPVLPDRDDALLPESGVFYDNAEEPPFNDPIIDVMAEPEDQEVDQAYESYRMELESVKAENVELKTKVEELREAYKELNEEFMECDRKRVSMEKIGKNYQRFLQFILKKAQEGMPANELSVNLQRADYASYMTGEIFNE